MPNKLTDNEIKKALECKPKAELIEMCNRLQAENSNLTSDLTSLQNDLTSAKAENERLKKSNRNWRRKVQRLRADLNVDLEGYASEYDNKIKAEAYKECAEKIKEKAYTYSDITGYRSTVVDVCEIDGVYEELVGDDNG